MRELDRPQNVTRYQLAGHRTLLLKRDPISGVREYEVFDKQTGDAHTVDIGEALQLINESRLETEA